MGQLSQQTGTWDNSSPSFSTSNLTFYNAAQGLKQTGKEDHLQSGLQTLLNQLIDKTNARGGLLLYSNLGTQTSLVSGKTDKEFEINQNEHRLLLIGKYFVKEKTSIHPILGNGRLMGILCIRINKDAWEGLGNDLVHAYAQLAAQNIELHRKQTILLKYADSLSEKKQELEQIQEYNQNLLSVTAHDLSSPLNAVSGYLEMIDEYLGNNGHANKLYNYYKRIQSGVSDMSEMLTQLDEVVKLKKGFSSLNSTKIEVNEVIREVCHLLSASAEKKEAHLQVVAEQAAIYINADEIKFKRVIYNLVSNAIKYNRRHQAIRVRTDTKNGQLYIYIMDRGKGISEENMKTIFDPFVKHHSMDKNTASYGLGLYISSYFTELMDGRIIAESQPGKGSTFTVVLPVADVPSMQSNPA